MNGLAQNPPPPEILGLAGLVALVSPDSRRRPGLQMQHDQALQSEAEWFEAKTPDLRIRLCMNKLVREHGEEVVTQELEVELCSPDVPNLEVIDLPGIVAGSSPLAQATVELTRSYIQRPNALVLCMVLAATPSLRTNQAMALVEEAPGAKARTIVALTMW